MGLPTNTRMSPALPRPFIRLAWSNLAAQSAEQLSLAATPIVAVLALDAGAGQVGLLATAQTLPFLLLSIPLGLLADRTSRRRLMVWAELLRLLALLGMLAAVLAGQLSIPLLAALGFMGAVGTVGFSVAAPALVPALVPRDALAQANGRLELARSVAFAAGPALAGALVSWAGASAAFVLAAALSASALVLLLRIGEPARVAAPARHGLLELRDGAGLVWRHELLRPIFMTGVVWNLSWFVLQAAYVPYAMRLLGLSASAVGLTLAAYGAGMVTGALLARRIVASIPFGRAIERCWSRPGCWPRWHFSCSAPGPLSGPSPPSRYARPSRLAPCWAVYRPSSSPVPRVPGPSAPRWVDLSAPPGVSRPAWRWPWPVLCFRPA